MRKKLEKIFEKLQNYFAAAAYAEAGEFAMARRLSEEKSGEPRTVQRRTTAQRAFKAD